MTCLEEVGVMGVFLAASDDNFLVTDIPLLLTIDGFDGDAAYLVFLVGVNDEATSTLEGLSAASTLLRLCSLVAESSFAGEIARLSLAAKVIRSVAFSSCSILAASYGAKPFDIRAWTCASLVRVGTAGSFSVNFGIATALGTA